MKPKGPKDPEVEGKTDLYYPPRRKRREDELKLDQAFPLTDNDDPDNECYQYLKQVNEQAVHIDQQLEERKHEDYVLNTTPYVLPKKVTPILSKGVGLSDCDEQWKKETLLHYNECQRTLLMRRDEIKENYPECMYQCDQSLESLVHNQAIEGVEEVEEVTSKSKYKAPSMDDVARCSEGFLHYCIRYVLDLIEEECSKEKKIPQEIQLWVYYFLIMMEKPLIPDLAADLNELLGIYEEFNDLQKSEKMSDSKPDYTMYDSTILIITEHFGQKFQY
ncbi:unnamed protein product [Moneuplotes crassus]|uniref:Uncharacterized protein n=1 Tax=Euplotes crassus TaxID=5936 RepID=A0AAD2D376_EUPCR|nr:unnamed protein product [Moneuplotes crassus]